jgi:cyanophycinase
MSTYLVGGGRDQTLHQAVYGSFRAEAAAVAASRGSGVPEVGLVVVHEADQDGRDDLAWFGAALAACGAVTCRPLPVPEGEVLPADGLAGLDALLVAGGLTPAYASALGPAAGAVRALVAGGAPYLGFSAGAAVAAGPALVGGFRLAGTVVTGEDNAEECEELTVVDGLGLVDLAVDVHAAQWGTVTRLVSAVAAGLVPSGVAVDEGTVLVLAAGAAPRVSGAGQVWWVDQAGEGQGEVRVRLQATDG